MRLAGRQMSSVIKSRRISTRRMLPILNAGLTKAWPHDGEYLADGDIQRSRILTPPLSSTSSIAFSNSKYN